MDRREIRFAKSRSIEAFNHETVNNKHVGDQDTHRLFSGPPADTKEKQIDAVVQD